MRSTLLLAAFAVAAVSPVGGAFAASAIQKECSAKYQAAKAANTLNGLKYKDFYKQCAAEAKAGGGAAAPATAGATPAAAPATPAVAPAAPRAPATTTAAAPAAAPAAAGPAVFPTAIAPQYQSLKPGVARRKTCDDQYNANKATNGNGGLKWIEKGGGYYSECNKRLKG
jgi:hypothetical protein